MPFSPQIPDKQGRGTLCALLDTLAKAVIKHRPEGERPDPDECARAMKRLDETRAQFHRLYGHKPRPQEE